MIDWRRTYVLDHNRWEETPPPNLHTQPFRYKNEGKIHKLVAVEKLKPTDKGTSGCTGCISDTDTEFRCSVLPNCDDCIFVEATKETIAQHIAWRLTR